MKMADVYGFEPEAEPPSIRAIGLSPTRFDDRDMELMAAVSKVASCHALCVALNQEMEATGAELSFGQPRCRALELADSERRKALSELSDTPATTAEACRVKLKIIEEMMVAYGPEDPEMVARLLEFAHESLDLNQRLDMDKPMSGSWRKTLTNSRSLRRFMGVAIALSSAVSGRFDTGGIS
jgi:hypothetical protein